MATRVTATVEDVLRLGAQGERYELIDGELVRMPDTGFEHGDIEGQIGWLFRGYADRTRLGKVVVGEVLFQLDRAAGIARAADVAFIRRERIPDKSTIKGAFVGAPDVAVEIVLPSNTAEEIQLKIQHWLAYGTQIVLMIYPDSRSAVRWTPGGGVSLRGDDEVNLDPAMPGFRCMVNDLFPSAL